ncbi:hypothetical protein [Streptomyces sp. NPDC090022]|uniref:hypothetical protein n=1 Tax=Streptomyces sp. NPDC090022 TaxID=3365920 RepID=UPI0037F42A9D
MLPELARSPEKSARIIGRWFSAKLFDRPLTTMAGAATSMLPGPGLPILAVGLALLAIGVIMLGIDHPRRAVRSDLQVA